MKKYSCFKTPVFKWPIRIYYEDTDAAGVVYYANYLRFFERCRTEWLRAIGFDQKQIADESSLVFVVRNINVDYLKPAKLDDQLICTLAINKIGGAQIVFDQEICRENEDVLVRAEVRVVCVDTRIMKSAPMPQGLRQKLENLI